MSSIFQRTPTNSDYVSPTQGITLLAGRAEQADKGLSLDVCQLIQECGFNAVIGFITVSDLKSTLDNCQDCGLKLFIGNGNLTTDTYRFVNDFKGHPALGGWLLDTQVTDEELKSANEGLSRVVSNINQYDDFKHPVFLGLQGDWDYAVRHKIFDSYPSYIADFQEKLQPSFWPYIYFPELLKAGETAVSEERKMMFYKNLQYYAYISRYTSVPFWTFVRCQSFSNYNGYSAPYPTAGLLRGLVFASLAYGAQGIYYWNFRQNKNPEGQDLYTYAPINYNGTPDPDITKALREVNNEVRTFNRIFYGCDLVEARYWRPNNSEITANTGYLRMNKQPIGPLLYVAWPSDTKGYDLIITHIGNGGKNYLIIVANPFGPVSLTKTTQKSIKQKILLNFLDYWRIYQLERIDNNYIQPKPIGENLEVEVSNGDYLIFQWD